MRLFLQLLFLRDAARAFPILSPDGKQPISNGRLRWLTDFCWLLLVSLAWPQPFLQHFITWNWTKTKPPAGLFRYYHCFRTSSSPVKVREKQGHWHGRKHCSCRKLGKPRSVGVNPGCLMILTTWQKQKNKTEIGRVKFVRDMCAVVTEKTN